MPPAANGSIFAQSWRAPMPLRITPPSEPIATTSLIVTLFGQPGIGKSTLAYSAPKPLLLDFDGGAQRAAGRKDTVRVHSWADVADITAADVAPYETVALDTVGRALEFLAAELVKSNPKLGRSTGELTQQGYGALKSAFAQWLGRIRTFRSEEHTSELQSLRHLVCRLLLEKK